MRGFDVAVNPDDFLAKVELQGSNIALQHQELICALRSGRHIRLARNNCSDIIDGNAARRDFLPLIAVYMLPKNTTSIKDIVGAFETTHESIPDYLHGDCHVFSAAIVKILTGQDTGFGISSPFFI